jgi:hypothetical protein
VLLPIRLTRMQKFIDQDQMQNLAMIPAKDAKMFSYKLMEENYLQIKELKKGTSNVGPVKSFNLFYVDLPQVMKKIFCIYIHVRCYCNPTILRRLYGQYWK